MTRSRSAIGLLGLTLGLLVLGVGPVEAQSAGQAAARRPDPVDPRVPAGAVRSYIDAGREGDFERAAAFLNLEGIPANERAELGAVLARQLKIVLDRKLWVEYERMSTDFEGDTDDGLPPGVDRIEGHGELTVLVERVREDDGEQVWKIASSTVARIPELYARYGYGPLGEILPASAFEIRFLELQR